MDKEMNQKYSNVSFPSDIEEMFIDIINKDLVSKKVLNYITRIRREQKKAVTIIDIAENLKIERRVGIKNGKTMQYEKRFAAIDRKTVERSVDKLSGMSLISYELMKPYKLLSPTLRGAQIVQKLQSRKEVENNG
ncbi:hypothetical protein [Bacillus cihuensis]|uniref:hypothetical protein n=1 Tax=Bacillus cihuensis TaxID=1208599 RepID=UPI00040EFB60|nr:hypothetical protein [Bacillus cihuensis]